MDISSYRQIKGADCIEDVLCLSSLIMQGKLSTNSNLHDADDYYNEIGGCENCPFESRCLACIINQ